MRFLLIFAILSASCASDASGGNDASTGIACSPPGCADTDPCTRDVCDTTTGTCAHPTTWPISHAVTRDGVTTTEVADVTCGSIHDRTSIEGGIRVSSSCFFAFGMMRANISVLTPVDLNAFSADGAFVYSGCSTASALGSYSVSCCF